MRVSLAEVLEQLAARARALLEPDTDQLLLRARASGERLVAKVRVGVVALLCIAALVLRPPGVDWALTVGALLYAGSLWLLTARYFQGWVPWLTCALDVLLVTCMLATFVRAGQPLAATNGRVLYECYFLAVMTSGVRYEWRLSAWTSLLAALGYLGIVLVARHLVSLGATAGAAEYGRFDLTAQLLRVALLVTAGVVMATVAQVAKSMRLMVGVDHLTGLSQRAPFVERIDEELSRARRRGTPLSVTVIDIDGFKAFNDAHGHPAGDRALQLVAARLRASVRKSDLVARFGGEEFVIAFPETEVEQAALRVEHLRAELARTPIVIGRESHRLTVSAGVGSWPADGESFDAVLSRTDARLYEAKRKGRNQVVGPPPVQLATVTELKTR